MVVVKGQTETNHVQLSAGGMHASMVRQKVESQCVRLKLTAIDRGLKCQRRARLTVV